MSRSAPKHAKSSDTTMTGLPDNTAAPSSISTSSRLVHAIFNDGGRTRTATTHCSIERLHDAVAAQHDCGSAGTVAVVAGKDDGAPDDDDGARERNRGRTRMSWTSSRSINDADGSDVVTVAASLVRIPPVTLTGMTWTRIGRRVVVCPPLSNSAPPPAPAPAPIIAAPASALVVAILLTQK